MLFEYETSKEVRVTYQHEEGTLRNVRIKNEVQVVKYHLIGTGFTIRAEAEGVTIVGHSIRFKTQEELDEVYKVIQWAYRHHESMRDTGKHLDQTILSQELLA